MSLSPTTSSLTKCGRFVLDRKNRMLMLPDEEQEICNSQRQNKPSGSEVTNCAISNDASSDCHLDPTISGMPSRLSSIETHSAMFGEASSCIETSEIMTCSTSSFRSDVRNDWVDAIFGKDFFPINNNNSLPELSVRQGTGQAGIAHYVTYGTVLDPSRQHRYEHSVTGDHNINSNKNILSNDKGIKIRNTIGNGPFSGLVSRSAKSKTRSEPLVFSTSNLSLVGNSLLGSGSWRSGSCMSGVEDEIGIDCHDQDRYNDENNHYDENLEKDHNHLKKTPHNDDSLKDDSFLRRRSSNSIDKTLSKDHADGDTNRSRSNSNHDNEVNLYQSLVRQDSQPKMGATISRIPLGLYVRAISLNSEAYTLGVTPGSILVSINGMALLGETSHRALERLWRYDGVFAEEDIVSQGIHMEGEDPDRTPKMMGNRQHRERQRTNTQTSTTKKSWSNTISDTNTATTSNNNNHCNAEHNKIDLRVTKPVVLRLYKNGIIYSTLFLSGKPLSGIEWGPCGNFALVQRSSGLAAECGIRRGSLVVGVDNEGLRTLDHSGVAARLKERFTLGEHIIVTLGYTPVASRSGFFGREEKSQNPPNNDGISSMITSEPGHPPSTSRSHHRSTGSVEVRSRPVEYGTAMVETFLACAGPSAMAAVIDSEFDASKTGRGVASGCDGRSLIADAAIYVAAGGVLPRGRLNTAIVSKVVLNQRQVSTYRRVHANSERSHFVPCPQIEPDRLLSEWDPLLSLTLSMSYSAAGCCETTFIEMGGLFRAGHDESISKLDGEVSNSAISCIDVMRGIAKHSPPGVAEEVFDAHLLQLLEVATSTTLELSTTNGSVEKNEREGNNHWSETLLDILVDVAMDDINLCQRLFFLLRTYIGVIEEQRGANGIAQEKSLLPLKLIRYAQRRLSGRMLDRSACNDEDRHCSEGYPMNRESSSSSRIMQYSLQQLAIATSESSLRNNNRIDSQDESCQNSIYPTQEPIFTSSSCSANDPETEENSSIEDPSSCNTLATQTNGENFTMTNYEGAQISKKNKGKKILRLFTSAKAITISKKSDVSTLPPSVVIRGRKFSPDVKATKSSKHEKSFSFSNVFQKQTNAGISLPDLPQSFPRSEDFFSLTMSQKFENMSWILRQIDSTCCTIEKNLMKSFPQKMADLALFPWSASKESALSSITLSFRAELRLMNSDSNCRFPVLNPVDPLELLTSVDADECFILPSAHFPLLLCFTSRQSIAQLSESSIRNKRSISHESNSDTLYRTKVEILGIRGTVSKKVASDNEELFVVQGAIAGVIQESGTSDPCNAPALPNRKEITSPQWTKNNILVFETRSNWGFPKTLSFKVSTLPRNTDSRDDIVDSKGSSHYQSDVGCGFLDLTPFWDQLHKDQISCTSSLPTDCKTFSFDNVEEFDQQGFIENNHDSYECAEITLRISVEKVSSEIHNKKRLLLYKHGDDLRQELLAIQFIERCNQILKASGLDLKLKTFRCLPVAANKGFIEWVTGTVPLSELCQTTGSSYSGSNGGSRQSSWSKDGQNLDDTQDSFRASPIEVVDQASRHQAGRRSWCKHQCLRGLHIKSNGCIIENPIQDFLRSAAFDQNAPYFVKKDVMDNYVKSCAGYCVITYLLGVGDRHLDNILLHQNGHLLHCDYSFILGNDPKTYLPMRITTEMIGGFGGLDSDNFARFLSFTGAAFLTLRRHNNLHSLLSHVRNMISSTMRDISFKQPPEESILAMHGRFRLDLNDDDALTYIEQIVENSISSKMWRAVDVIHSLGKHF